MKNELYCPKCDDLTMYYGDSLMFSEHYVCIKCNLIYVRTVKPLKREDFGKKGILSKNRFDELIANAKRQFAMEKVNNEDLKKLGYLK